MTLARLQSKSESALSIFRKAIIKLELVSEQATALKQKHDVEIIQLSSEVSAINRLVMDNSNTIKTIKKIIGEK